MQLQTGEQRRKPWYLTACEKFTGHGIEFRYCRHPAAVRSFRLAMDVDAAVALQVDAPDEELRVSIKLVQDGEDISQLMRMPQHGATLEARDTLDQIWVRLESRMFTADRLPSFWLMTVTFMHVTILPHTQACACWPAAARQASAAGSCCASTAGLLAMSVWSAHMRMACQMAGA